MLCLRPMRALLRPHLPPTLFPKRLPNPTRAFTTLPLHRPSILPLHATAAPPPQTHPTLLVAPLDLLPRISSHPALAGIQVRNARRNTYDPSHRVRKRRAGFLARKATRGGRAVLKRRMRKGRSTLSH